MAENSTKESYYKNYYEQGMKSLKTIARMLKKFHDAGLNGTSLESEMKDLVRDITMASQNIVKHFTESESVIAENAAPNTDIVNKIITGFDGNINSVDKIKDFFKILMLKLDLNFHPDTPFEDYINPKTNQDVFSVREADALDRIMEQCFQFCLRKGLDIYEIAMEVAKPILKDNGIDLGGDLNESIDNIISEMFKDGE